ncbi:P-loop ATPase, Sll1717 family [Micromonospora chalcea]|uniref:P-loop ATPase, Sll1717 family n=1 Tax=Micromonospora chalcea TaxID=1874 RepID=UPI0033E00020
MAKTKHKTEPKRNIHGNLNLGGEIAEADSLLGDAFYESSVYRSIASRGGDAKCFVIGRTGSGKSAALQRIKNDWPDHVIEINPIDLSLPYITDLGVVRHLTALNVHLDSLYNALWKHVLLIEIIKHRYKIDSPDAKQRFIDIIMDKIKRDSKKKAALEYLEEFEGKFWCETDERVRDITNKFESQFKAAAGAKFGVKPVDFSANLDDTSTASTEERVELVRRFQRVVNETQLPRLNTMMNVLNDEILDSPQNYTYVLIDDLDKDWADDKVKNDLIRNLFQVVFDLKRVANLKVIVALRTNIFETLDFGRGGGQGEKFRALSMRVRWSPNELESMLDERARVAADRSQIEGISGVKSLLPNYNQTRGKALEFVLDRTLMRPRDAIAFLNEAFMLAGNKSRLSWEDIKDAEASYSRNRLLALRDEWDPTFSGVDRVLNKFRQAPALMTKEESTKYLDNCFELLADYKFDGVQWLTEVSEPFWNGAPEDDWADGYHLIVKLLFDIGFLGVMPDKAKKVVYGYDYPEYADSVANVRHAYGFVIHPAFRPALDVQTP